MRLFLVALFGLLISSATAAQVAPVQVVNVPRTTAYGETAVYSFGTVSPTTTSTDLRVGYDDMELFINANVIDSRLWYDASRCKAVTPDPYGLVSWDSVTVLLQRGGDTYRLDASFQNWGGCQPQQQSAFRNGAGISGFTTDSGWRGNSPNDDTPDQGWTVSFHIPWTLIGGLAATGEQWAVQVTNHNKDSLSGGVVDTTWQGLWHFGPILPYAPPAHAPAVLTAALYGSTVNVGGYTRCGENLSGWPDYWQRWGSINWQGQEYLNIMNQGDPADWPCYNKVYARFPLDALPVGEAVISATLTLYQYGHAGTVGQTIGPSLIQAYSVPTDWDPATINWNNAPAPSANIASAWAGLGDCPTYQNCPSIALDVSEAVAAAYAQGQPLRLMLYSSDGGISSGKYFFASETGTWNLLNRPLLNVQYAARPRTVTPTPSSTATPTLRPPTATATSTPSATATVTASSTATPTSSPTMTETPTPTPTPAYLCTSTMQVIPNGYRIVTDCVLDTSKG